LNFLSTIKEKIEKIKDFIEGIINETVGNEK
jgi:hypothetical protein